MAIGLEVFRWPVHEHGFVWIDATAMQPQETAARARDRRFLVARSQSHTFYRPLSDEPTLFKTFAALQPTEAAFAAFAADYGRLGVDQVLETTGPIQSGEPLSAWMHHWSNIRAIVAVLDAIANADAKALNACIDLRSDRAFLRLKAEHGHRAWSRLAVRKSWRPWLWDYALSASTRTERLARLASGWVQDQINDAMRPQTLHAAASAVTARILFNPDRQPFALHVVPSTLVAALWLQCARVLTENPGFRQCDHCHKWFELSPDAKRKHAECCSDRCRVARWREKQKKKESHDGTTTRTR